MSRGEIARRNFLNGYNCAQAVLLAFSDLTGMDRESLLRVSQPFGAGMGRLRLTCGAVSGAIMALGLITGGQNDAAGKNRAYASVQAFTERFTARNGSIVCAELLSGKGIKAERAPESEARSESYYRKRPCPELCAQAADILEEYLIETGYLPGGQSE